MNPLLANINAWLHKPIGKVAAASLFVVGLAVYQAPTASATFIVHDPKIYVQVTEQIKKATEQINKLKQQIDIQLKNLESLKKEHIDPIRKQLAQDDAEYRDVKSKLTGIWNDLLSARDAYKQQFEEFKDLDYKHMSYKDISNKISHNREELEKLNMEATELIQTNQKRLAESEAIVRKLMDQMVEAEKNKNTELGAKQYAQLQLLLSQQLTHSININSEIQSIAAKQEAYKAEIEKLEKDGKEAVSKKTASDFKEAQKKLDAMPKATKVEDAFDKAAKEMKWR